MQLVIAEKPSVARDLARVLGMRATGRNALEGPGRVITWCIGHLVELEEPAAYDPRWKSWRFDTLPMIPTSFKLRPVPGTRDQLRVVRDLLRDRRFTEVVNACDAGREGELIFRYVYELAGSRLAMRRLWISSLTDEAIRQGFAALRPGGAYDTLADAARCRSEADWLVGMNATRAVTLRFRASDGPSSDQVAQAPDVRQPQRETAWSNGRAGRGAKPFRRGRGYQSALPPVFSIGRVQTPTLAILVRREQEIRAFQPRDYWEVRGKFTSTPAPASKEPGDAGEPQTFTAPWTLRGEPGKPALTRFGARDVADAVVARAGAEADAGNPAVVETLTEKKSHEPPPLLFDLTSLQRTANRRYGFSATRTLEAAQALYERHKILTYPRTDSRHLPRDQVGELPKLFRGLARIATYAPFVEPLIAGDLTQAAPSRRIFDDAKVHDHHAIIPTGKTPAEGSLAEDEQRIFDLVARRFLGAFHPDAEFASTEAVIRVGPIPKPSATTETTTTTTAAATVTAATATTATTGTEANEQTLIAELPPPPDRFIARGRVRLVAGWQAVAGLDERHASMRPERGAGGRGTTEAEPGAKDAKDSKDAKDAEPPLPPLSKGQHLGGRYDSIARQTRPPARHTEATLLGTMESAGREIEDETLRAAMKDTGLGTPATRAATIETLVKRGFIAREGKQIFATPTGISLIERLPVPTLASPELTGAWEARLVRIARGQDTRAAFMTDIARYVREVTDAVRGAPSSNSPNANTRASLPTPAHDRSRVGAVATRVDRPLPPHPPSPALRGKGAPTSTPTSPLPCPRCRLGTLMAGKRGWGCSRWREDCSFVIWFELDGKRLTETQLRDLVEKGKTRKGKWSRPGESPVAGRIVLDLTGTREAGAARFLAG